MPALFMAARRKWHSVPGGSRFARLLTEALAALVKVDVIPDKWVRAQYWNKLVAIEPLGITEPLRAAVVSLRASPLLVVTQGTNGIVDTTQAGPLVNLPACPNPLASPAVSPLPSSKRQ